MKLVFYDDTEKFIRTLQKSTIAKLLHSFDLLEKYSLNLGMPHVKSLGAGIDELRIRGQQEARAFFVFHKGEIIILHMFIKKAQKIPVAELETAKRRRLGLT